MHKRAGKVILPQQIITELGDLPFMRKCMLGVKARAERRAEQERGEGSRAE
jgi:hypothetical protein